MPRPPSTEGEAQALLIRRAMRLHKRQAFCPNTTVYGWEADLLVTSRHDLVEEYEIKVSRSDWLSELKAMRQTGPTRFGTKAWRARYLDLGDANGPNYFWLAAPPDVISPDEVPGWAGYIVLHDVLALHGAEIVKRAPRLHTGKMRDEVRSSVERGIALRLSDQLWRKLDHDPSA